MDANIEVRFKTLDGASHTISFDPARPISELRRAVAWELRVDQDALVIIFRGKRLTDEHHLGDYHFESGKTLNVIARKKKPATRQRRANTGQGPAIDLENLGNASLRGNHVHKREQLNDELGEIQREVALQDQDEGQIFANIFKVKREKAKSKNLGDTSRKRKLLRKKIIQKRTFGFSVDEAESKEVVRQAVLAVENLLKCADLRKKEERTQMRRAGTGRAQDNESMDISESIQSVEHRRGGKWGQPVERGEPQFEKSEMSRNSLGEEIRFDLDKEIQAKLRKKKGQSTFQKLNYHKNSFTNLRIDQRESGLGLHQATGAETPDSQQTSNKQSLRSFGRENELSKRRLSRAGTNHKGGLGRPVQEASLGRTNGFENGSLRTVSLQVEKGQGGESQSEDFDLGQVEYKEGQWVDVLDSQNIWQEAQIVAVNGQQVRVHYNGTSDEMDQWLPVLNRRIALFRSHTTDSEGSYFLSPVPNKKVKMSLRSADDKARPESTLDEAWDVLKSFMDVFQETQIKWRTLRELAKEERKRGKKGAKWNRYEKHFSATKKFAKNANEETRSHVSFKISEKREVKTLFDDSRSVQNDTFHDKNTGRFKKKEIENLSPKSIKSQLSGLANLQHPLDDNISQFTYAVIQEETHLDDSAEDSHDSGTDADADPFDKAESIRAQKDFGLMAHELKHRMSELDDSVRARKRQLGVLCDRVGRLLIDLAPHLMSDGVVGVESRQGISGRG